MVRSGSRLEILMWNRHERHKVDQTNEEKVGHAVVERTRDEGPRAERSQHARGYEFVLGLVAGAAVGAALGLLFAPRAGSALRSRLAELPANLGRAASNGYRQTRARAGATVDGLVDKGRIARGKGWDAVARAARDVEAYANEGNPPPDRGAPGPADPAASSPTRVTTPV